MSDVHEYAPWHKHRFYVLCNGGQSREDGAVEKVWDVFSKQYWLPVLTAEEFSKLPNGAVVIWNAAGHSNHLSETVVDGRQFPLTDGLFALKSLPEPDGGYIATVDEEGLVEGRSFTCRIVGCINPVDELGNACDECYGSMNGEKPAASSTASIPTKDWLDGVTPWQFAMLLEVMSIEDDCTAPCGDVDGLLERSWRYLQKARGEA